MELSDQIRSLDGVPDHGFGPLGGLTHSVLTEYVGAAPTMPHLHLGHNILPNPPFPWASQVPMDNPLSVDWRECGADLDAFLRTGARELRSQPTPPISAYSPETRILQWVLRFDAIAMVWRDPRLAGFSMVALVVDRAGNCLTGRVPHGGDASDIEVVRDEPPADDDIPVLLHDVLLAQYEWTSAVFGLIP
jgi:hypothetical protein